MAREHTPSLKSGGDPMKVTPRDPATPDPHSIVGPDGLTDYRRWGASAAGIRGGNPNPNITRAVNMFEWLEQEIAAIKTPRFHLIDGPANAKLREAVARTPAQLSSDVYEFRSQVW